MSDLRLHLLPFYRGADQGDGGIRRVVEATLRLLPAHGFTLVDDTESADLVATHAVVNPAPPVGLPWVAHSHGLHYADFGWEAGWPQEVNRQLIEIYRAADHVTAPSEWVAQTLRRGMLLRPTVLYHGVDPAEWETDGAENEGYILWNKARADAASDPAPMHELARRMPGQRFVSTFGQAAPNVILTGRLPYEQAREVVKRAGVYLSTTRETFGIGTLEALAAGVPVVGWAWGGNREIIRHKETGWLAAPGDYEGLSEGLAWAIANRRSISDAARVDVAARWTWERAIARYAALYRRMVAGERAQREGPAVSVVIPCYNLGRFLPDALRSVQAQTLQNWEAIVVDDCSTDNSAEVAQAFAAADPRIRYIRNERNYGVSATRNRGFAEARGRYIAPLDADDCMTPEALALLSQALDADRGTHLAYGNLTIMSEAGELRDSPHDWPPVFDFKEQIQGRNQVPTFCMMRRSVFERTGGYRTRLHPVEDADLWTRAASFGMVPRKVTDAPTLLYRLRSNSLSRTLPQKPWVDWYPWSRRKALVPFAAAVAPPAGQRAHPVPSYEPVRVAVIIPVGPGHERLLIDALDSVEAQTLREWECIVVNDTGAPLAWLPAWARVVETAGRTGPAAARNAGVLASTAPLLLFLDADDYLQPDALAVLYATQREQGGVAYSDWWDDFGNASDAKVYEAPEYDARLLTARGCIHAVTALYPRSAFDQVGGFDTSLSHWEDWDLQLALAAKGVCGTRVPQPLWTYRKAAGQRREANAAAFDAGKRAILAKWGRVWEGREEIMACRACPGGGGKSTPKAPAMAAPAAGSSNGGGAGTGATAAPEGAQLLEFTGTSESTVSYRGKGTGATYRFGNNTAARRRYVLAADVPGFLGMSKLFRVAVQLPEPGLSGGELSPRLEAPGAASPARSTEVAHA